MKDKTSTMTLERLLKFNRRGRERLIVLWFTAAFRRAEKNLKAQKETGP